MSLGVILAVVLSGFLIGGAARYVVPGPDPMPFWLTVLIGFAGSVVGGAIGLGLYGTGGVTRTHGHVFVTVMLEPRRRSSFSTGGSSSGARSPGRTRTASRSVASASSGCARGSSGSASIRTSCRSSAGRRGAAAGRHGAAAGRHPTSWSASARSWRSSASAAS